MPNPAATGKGGTGTITKYAKVALLGGDTLVEIQPNKQQKLLEFEKHESADRGHTLFNPDWKFADMGIGGLDAEFSRYLSSG